MNSYTCSNCSGKGTVEVTVDVSDPMERSGRQTVTIDETCPACHGSGVIVEDESIHDPAHS